MLLIQAGVPLDAVDAAYGRTAAHWAAHYNQYELLDIVILAGNNYTHFDRLITYNSYPPLEYRM